MKHWNTSKLHLNINIKDQNKSAMNFEFNANSIQLDNLAKNGIPYEINFSFGN